MAQMEWIDVFLNFSAVVGKGIIYHFFAGLLIGCLGSLMLWLFSGAKPVLRFNIAFTFIASMLGSWIACMAFVFRDWIHGFGLSGSMKAISLSGQEYTALQQSWSFTDHNFFSQDFILLLAGIIWLAGMFFLSFRNLGAYIFLKRNTQRNTFVAPEPWQTVVQNLANRMNIRKRIQLLVGYHQQPPFTIGFFKPLIIVPASMLSGMPQDQIEAIFIHELWHIRRNDYLLHLLATAMVTLMFYHPLVWIFRRVMQLEREHICDDLSLKMGCKPNTLALAMIQLQQMQYVPLIISFSNNTSGFKGRIMRLFEKPDAGQVCTSGRLIFTGIAFLIMISAVPIFRNLQKNERARVAEQTNVIIPVKADLTAFQAGLTDRIASIDFQKSIDNMVEQRSATQLQINGENVPFRKDFDVNLKEDSIVFIPANTHSTRQEHSGDTIKVFTNGSKEQMDVIDDQRLTRKNEGLSIRQTTDKKNPLIVIDGEVKGKMKDIHYDLNTMSADNIASLNVLNDKSATENMAKQPMKGQLKYIPKVMKKKIKYQLK